VCVGIRTEEALARAIAQARELSPVVLLEEFAEGDDLRVIVIGDDVVAAAIRKPPVVVGDGEHTVVDLIVRESRRRAAATGGESKIPLDPETTRCVQESGYALDDVLPVGTKVTVRRAANLHTGGTIHDVTAELHPTLREVAVRAARALEIPVMGLDLIVPDVGGAAYWIIEANERPGLANHEPQPTAARFVDFLFPGTIGVKRRA
jgi:GNAT-family acetyltransferase (TIGR03103 family)